MRGGVGCLSADRHRPVGRGDSCSPRVDVRLALHGHGSPHRGARRLEGRGIEIRGLSIGSLHSETSSRDLLYIDEMFLECRADLSELLGGHPRVKRLIVRRMKLHATCSQEGRWNIAGLLPPPNFGGSLPAMVLEDSTVELQDLCRQSGGVWALRNINLQAKLNVDPEGRQQWGFAGKLLGDHFKHVEVKGFLDPHRGSWSATGTLDGLEMSQRLLDAVPNDIAKYVSLLATLRALRTFRFSLGT